MMEHLWEIVLFLVTGGGIGSVITWFSGKKGRQLNQRKEEHNVYQTLYSDVSALLETTQKELLKLRLIILEVKDENASLRRSVNRLQNTIKSATACPYYAASCPMREQLQDGKADDEAGASAGTKRPKGQQRHGDKPPAGNGTSSGGDDKRSGDGTAKTA
jgi:hypothetical protein